MSTHALSLSSSAGWLATLIPVAVQFVLFLRWLHRRMRNDEITRAFVRDIATNHICRTSTTRYRKSPQSRELLSTKRRSSSSST